MTPIIIMWLMREHERHKNLDLGPPPVWAAVCFLLISIGFAVAVFWDAYSKGRLF